MASEERDRKFDQAIARHLRSAAASGDAASRAADSVSHRDSCPDAETLAAYHERSLLPAELNAWKEHLVGCAHCQELLAHLEGTDDIPLHAAEEEELFTKMDTRPASAARRVAPLPMAAAAPGRSQRAARWRWLAPAGALAAGLLVWMAMHETPPRGSPSSNEIKMAKNQEPPASAPSLSTRVPSAERREPNALPKPPSATDEISSSSAVEESKAQALEQRQTADSRARLSPAKPSADKENGARKDAGRASSGDLLANRDQPELDAKIVGGEVQPKVEVQAQGANVQSQNQNNASLPRISGPAPLGQVGTSKKLKTAPPPSPAPASPASASPPFGYATEMVVVSEPNLITVPGSNLFWRTGPAGLIEFSSDGGHSWSRQRSGVLVDLLTGLALSDKTCWIVGRVGAILLTTDGGAHWKLISSPLKEDLGGIQATDALHATVWSAHGTKSFATSDGGLTWERVQRE